MMNSRLSIARVALALTLVSCAGTFGALEQIDRAKARYAWSSSPSLMFSCAQWSPIQPSRDTVAAEAGGTHEVQGAQYAAGPRHDGLRLPRAKVATARKVFGKFCMLGLSLTVR